ncbi:hypothetical protein P692DRAFT_20680945, partial [Suillus brevipes Sb2]
VSPSRHVIMDRGCANDDDVEIPSYLLAKPAFFISDWYFSRLGIDLPASLRRCAQRRVPMGDLIAERVVEMLNAEPHLPGERIKDRFTCERIEYLDGTIYEVHDRLVNHSVWTDLDYLCNEKLNVSNWYAKKLIKAYRELSQLMLSKELEWEDNHFRLLDNGSLSPMDCALEEVVHQLYAVPDMKFEETPHQFRLIELNGQQVAPGRYPAIERNSAIARDFKRLIPKPVVIDVRINRRTARALVDTGSLADFMSSTLADQLRVKRIMLDKPLTIQLAVQGSRSRVNFG